MSLTIDDAEHAAWTLGRLGAVEDACKAIRKAVQDWAAEHGDVPVGDGKAWGPVVQKRETIDLNTAGAMAAFCELNAAELEQAAPRKTSKAQLTKALGKKRAADVVGRLRAEGAVMVSDVTRWTIHKA